MPVFSVCAYQTIKWNANVHIPWAINQSLDTMVSPQEDSVDSTEEEYEEYIEFRCPLCDHNVSEEDTACPGCGAIFVSSDTDEAVETATNGGYPDLEADTTEGNLTEDYELDDDLDYADLNDEEIEAELAAMEANLDEDLTAGEIEAVDNEALDVDEYNEGLEAETYDLDLSYEEDLEAEEEVEQAFGTPVKVNADDHVALQEMSKPNMMERMFQRTGMGMFIAGGGMSVLIILWDSLHGQPLALGMTQLRFLVLSVSMFIVGFIIEMAQAYSLTSEDELLHADLVDA